MQIPKVRRILHFKSQRAQYQGIQNSTITNFFTILLLQCNSKGRIVLQHNSKTYNIFLFTFSDSLSLSLSLSLCTCLFLISFLSPQQRLSLITSLSHGGLFWCGSWVRCGGETGEVRSAWYGGNFQVFLGTFFGFMGMLHCGMVVCGDVFVGFRRGLQRRDRFVAGFV